MEHKQFKIIPALDTTDVAAAGRLVEALGGLEDVYGFKLGFALGLAHGLPKVVTALRRFTAKPLIYDHQKAGTDIPDTGSLFAATVRGCGVDEVILFPHAGPSVLRAWNAACALAGLKVIVGGLMTHANYLKSEGGFLGDESVEDMYRIAHDEGVRAFVVSLTKPDLTRTLMERAHMSNECEFYSPGYGSQGGDPAAFGFLRRHYVIVGRSLLKAPDPVAYVTETARVLGRHA